MKKCLVCGIEFKNNAKQIYCTPKCFYKQYEGTEKRKQWRKIYEQTPDRKEYLKNYRKSDARKIILKKYEQSEKGKICRSGINKRWNASKSGKTYRRKYNKQYFQSEKGKEATNKYLQSTKGKTNRIKMQTLREQRLNFIPIMNNPFPKEVAIEWHHVNDLLVVPSPKGIHQSCPNTPLQIHREYCDTKLKLLGFDFTIFNK